MARRYRVTFVERVARRVTVDVDFPEVVPIQEVYIAARKMVTEEARQRENNSNYYPDLQPLGTNYLGEVPDVEGSAAERESSEQVLTDGQEASGNVGSVDVAGA